MVQSMPRLSPYSGSHPDKVRCPASSEKHSHLGPYKELGGVSKSMLKQSRLNFDKIEKCE
jgi:hypothetical protein